ncbi:MAG: amidohydrolase [Planctomycetes bacterium]|nr:amidohydrolase [Planctomycetota bacterium]
MDTILEGAWMLPALVALMAPATTQGPGVATLHDQIDRGARQVMSRVIAWRRDFHQHPELGNREVRTSGIVADHLRALGLEVRANIAHTGVVGVLRGGRPGPVVALRADMDALPVTEEADLPFKSTVRAEYNGREVGVMHACGHDAHMSMLMGAAEVLAGMKADLPGTVVFLFQPAEEGAPAGEDGGAALMIKEGALDNPKVEAVFGLHVFPFEAGGIHFRPRGIMAASDTLAIRVRGRQTHGALPWDGVDPIVVSSQIILGLQTIVSRQSNLTTAPAIVTIGRIEGGNRSNIIPDEVVMEGTIRTFDPDMQRQIHDRIRRTVAGIAQAAGATAETTITMGNPVTYNDPALTGRMTATLRRVAAGDFNPDGPVTTTAEDVSLYLSKVPGLYFFLGITPKGADPAAVFPNHSPRFFVDEGALVTGVRALASLAVDYLTGSAPQDARQEP